MEMGNVSKRQHPTIEQTTAEGHQQVFNAARNFRTRRRPSAGIFIKLPPKLASQEYDSQYPFV